ncbi:Uncharacterized protein APZ42_029703 [Daphnia magna]|uniref:Uncharacterized protein n=1 Tax=Daphnia magna TaxID=35525 RepID=A0A164PE63_9CRUS|nr:Uncharacterized protein APZ42_029703 [Daphnia magna]
MHGKRGRKWRESAGGATLENKSARKNVMDIGPFHRYVDNQMLIEFRRGSVVSCTCQLKRIYSPILNIITKKKRKIKKTGSL